MVVTGRSCTTETQVPLSAAPRPSELHPDGDQLRFGTTAVGPTSLPDDAERPLGFPPDGATVVAHADLPGRPRSRDGGLPGLRPAPSFRPRGFASSSTAAVRRVGPVDPSIRPAGSSTAGSKGEKH